MKFALLLSFLILFQANSQEIPEVPQNICLINHCTEKMQEFFDGFLAHPNPVSVYPTMYSGECYHKSPYLDENQKRFVGLLANSLFLAPVFQYTGEINEMQDWSTNFASRKLYKEWHSKGKFLRKETTTILDIRDAQNDFGYVYWVRQNLLTDEVYLISYQANWTVAFCKLTKNK